MRRAGFIAIALAALLGACSAVDDFRKFKFVNDGGADDMPAQLPTFGQACTDVCATPIVSRPLTCYHMFGSVSLPGGMCTRTCTPSTGLVACSDFPDAVCVHVENMDVCLPTCNAMLGRSCRTGYACCDQQHMVNGPGACAPSQTDLCH